MKSRQIHPQLRSAISRWLGEHLDAVLVLWQSHAVLNFAAAAIHAPRFRPTMLQVQRLRALASLAGYKGDLFLVEERRSKGGRRG